MSKSTTTFARSAIFSALTLPLLLAGQTGAQSYTQQLQKSIGIDQKLGDQIPLDLEFTDSNGQRTALRQYFGKKPIVLTLVYYECPMLCTQVLNSPLAGHERTEFWHWHGLRCLDHQRRSRGNCGIGRGQKGRVQQKLPRPRWFYGLAFSHWRGRPDQATSSSGRLSLRIRRRHRPVHPCQRLDGADARRQIGALFIWHRLPPARLALGSRRSSRRHHR